VSSRSLEQRGRADHDHQTNGGDDDTEHQRTSRENQAGQQYDHPYTQHCTGRDPSALPGIVDRADRLESEPRTPAKTASVSRVISLK